MGISLGEKPILSYIRCMHPISHVLTIRNLFLFFFITLILGSFLGFFVCKVSYNADRDLWKAQFQKMDSVNAVLQKKTVLLNQTLHKSDSLHAISLQESRIRLEDLANKKRIVSKDIDTLIQRVHTQDSLRKVTLVGLLKPTGNSL